MNPALYIASDYSGFSAGSYRFYFGYEQTVGDEWAFVAWNDGKEIMRLGQSALGVRHSCAEYLLAGVSRFITEHVK